MAEDLEVIVYEVIKGFPHDELYRTVDQIKRSSSSVSNNIAESYHKTTVKEKERILGIAKGELEETKRNILKSARKKFINEEKANEIADQYTVLLKGINAYINFLRRNDSDKK